MGISHRHFLWCPCTLSIPLSPISRCCPFLGRQGAADRAACFCFSQSLLSWVTRLQPAKTSTAAQDEAAGKINRAQPGPANRTVQSDAVYFSVTPSACSCWFQYASITYEKTRVHSLTLKKKSINRGSRDGSAVKNTGKSFQRTWVPVPARKR